MYTWSICVHVLVNLLYFLYSFPMNSEVLQFGWTKYHWCMINVSSSNNKILFIFWNAWAYFILVLLRFQSLELQELLIILFHRFKPLYYNGLGKLGQYYCLGIAYIALSNIWVAVYPTIKIVPFSTVDVGVVIENNEGLKRIFAKCKKK